MLKLAFVLLYVALTICYILEAYEIIKQRFDACFHCKNEQAEMISEDKNESKQK